LFDHKQSQEEFFISFKDYNIISKFWKEMAKTNLVSNAFHVAKANVIAFLLLTIEDWVQPPLMTYDIWCHSIVALSHAKHGRGVNNPLHHLSLAIEGGEECNKDNFLFGAQGGGYCDVEDMSDCDCEATSALPCVILRNIMHDV
jgi:hypothetical protein